MKTWAPLWSTIIDSSVWGESKEVKILWITMLAKKDRDGIVWGALPGLARAAVLSLVECERALKILLAPDHNSTSKAFEGRRIEAVPGGWKVLNHEVYRTAISAEYRRNYNAQKQREYRARKKQDQTAEAAFAKAEGDPEKEARVLAEEEQARKERRKRNGGLEDGNPVPP